MYLKKERYYANTYKFLSLVIWRGPTEGRPIVTSLRERIILWNKLISKFQSPWKMKSQQRLRENNKLLRKCTHNLSRALNTAENNVKMSCNKWKEFNKSI